MRNLRLYNTDAAFKAHEQAAGGDGLSTETIVPGVSMSKDIRKRYFNPHDESIKTCQVTIHYKTEDGALLSDSEVKIIKYVSGITSEILLYPKSIVGYAPIETSKTIFVPNDSEINFVYTLDKKQPLTFIVKTSGYISWWANSSDSWNTATIEYSRNGGSWKEITSKYYGSSHISVSAGDVIKFRGNNSHYCVNKFTISQPSLRYSSFGGSTAQFEVLGNISSLIKKEKFDDIEELNEKYTFTNLFAGCAGLTDASKLILPSGLTEGCYWGLFYKCESLTKAPVLKSTNIKDASYRDMFASCYALKKMPELPAGQLSQYCYAYMFDGCSSLTETVESLPFAQLLPNNCYYCMFNGCINITKAPSILSKNFGSYCCCGMFSGCSSLSYITCAATDISAQGSTLNWVAGVAESGIFKKDEAMTQWTTGNDGIPSSWTVQNV